MIRIEYTHAPPKIRQHDGREEIFCIIRKRWMLITPEEWVRQNFLLYLIHTMNFPPALIAVEKQLLLGEVKKRFDIIVYRNALEPFMIIECKEMSVALSQDVLLQVLRYNIPTRAPYLVITNGTSAMVFTVADGRLSETDTIPSL